MKVSVILLCALLLFSLFACTDMPQSPEIAETAPANGKAYTGFRTYYEMPDGTWQWNGYTYQYRLEIIGRMPQAAKDSRFVYLSNLESIPFQKAYLAAGVSSNSNDYFSPEEAVLVELDTID